MSNPELHLGNCLEIMKSIPDGSIDMILCDLPYGTTRNKWDSVLPLCDIWDQYLRIIRGNGAIVLTAQTPFDKVLGVSQINLLRYEWIWEKEAGTGHLNSKFAPMKSHENVLVFSKGAACNVKRAENAMPYFPQMAVGIPYEATKGSLSNNYDRKHDKIVTTKNTGNRFPKTVHRFSRDKEKLHPTQKPVALMEYLIRTYTPEPDKDSYIPVVLDNCMGSGTTGVACINTGRNFVGIEINQDYFNIAQDRINKAHERKCNELSMAG